jgi:hypothetical protein
MQRLVREILELTLAVGWWGWLAALTMVMTALLALHAPEVLWPATPGVVTGDGERVSYAARGRELTLEERDLPPVSTPVTVYYNPLLPRFATLDPALDIQLPQAAWFTPAALGWTVLAMLGLFYKGARRGDPTTHETYTHAFDGVSALAWLAGMLPLAILLGGVVVNTSLLSPPLPRLFSALVGALVTVTGVLLVAGPYPTLDAWFKSLAEDRLKGETTSE